MHLRSILLACATTLVGTLNSSAQVSLTTSSYTQNFDSLATSGTANAWSNNTTLQGWYLYTAAGSVVSTYAAGIGDTNAGAFYSFGLSSATDRAFGGVASGGAYFGSPAAGTRAGYIAAAFTNNTSAAFTGVTLNYDGEQWRNGGNTTAQTMKLEYGFGASFSAVSSWTEAPASFHFTGPVATSTAAAVNGNVAGLVSNLGGTLIFTWSAGQTLWLRWVENNDVSNDHGLAIDNFSLTANAPAVPEPSTYAALLGAAGLLGVIAHRRMRRGAPAKV